MKISILLILFSLLNLPISAQLIRPQEPFIRCLTLQMTGKKRNVNFYEGSIIVAKLYDDKLKYSFQIVRLTDSSFFYAPNQNQTSIFDLQEIKFKEIRKIYLGKGKGSIMDKIGLLGTAGIMLFSFDILNQIGKPKIEISPAIVSISTGLITISLLIKTLRNNTYNINKRHYFHLYHLSKESRKL
jgi:hypothetical protein